MAKYLDEPGLIHFMGLIKTALSNLSNTLTGRTHRHSIGSTTGSAASVTAGTAASLSTETKTFVTSASSVTLGTPISVPNISVAAATTDTVKGVNVFTANTPSNASVSGHKLIIVDGSAASLTTTNKTFTTDATKATTGTAISVPNVTGVSAASTGTVKGVDTFTANTPTAVTPATVVTSVDAYTGSAGI